MMNNNNYFTDKVVWITGASSGIGKAMARALDTVGARLILSARNENALKQIIDECQNADNHQILAFDLTEQDKLASVAKKAWKLNGKIDVLFNNGGISQRSLGIDTDLAVDRKVMEVDYFAHITITKALLPKLIEQKSGLVVNISSVAGKVGVPLRTAYSAAKHALIGFMDSLRAEVAPYGIRVVNVCPGFVQTNISVNAVSGDMSQHGKMDDEIAQGIPVDEFIQILLKKLSGNKDEIIIAKGLGKLAYQMRRLIPNVYFRLLPKIYKRNKA